MAQDGTHVLEMLASILRREKLWRAIAEGTQGDYLNVLALFGK